MLIIKNIPKREILPPAVFTEGASVELDSSSNIRGRGGSLGVNVLMLSSGICSSALQTHTWAQNKGDRHNQNMKFENYYVVRKTPY